MNTFSIESRVKYSPGDAPEGRDYMNDWVVVAEKQRPVLGSLAVCSFRSRDEDAAHVCWGEYGVVGSARPRASPYIPSPACTVAP